MKTTADRYTGSRDRQSARNSLAFRALYDFDFDDFR